MFEIGDVIRIREDCYLNEEKLPLANKLGIISSKHKEEYCDEYLYTIKQIDAEGNIIPSKAFWWTEYEMEKTQYGNAFSNFNKGARKSNAGI